MKKLLSKIYNKVVKIRNKNFDSGKSKIYHCSKPVISIGNLSIGGSGKTPFTITLTNIIKELGYKPAIVGRGYKRKSKGEIIVSDGKKILSDVSTSGDEMYLLAEKLSIPVISHDLKYKGALSAEKLFDIDCIIIDDGFQHRRLFRDLDIVLIDSETLNKPYLIPHGKLREPLESLSRADIVCLVGNLEDKFDRIKELIKPKIVCNVKVIPNEPYLMNDLNPPKKVKNLLQESKKNIISVCGIAKPKNFEIMLNALDYNIIYQFTFDDHHNYTISNINNIIHQCKVNEIKLIATTEKDSVKLKQFGSIFATNNIDILVFPITMKIFEGKEELIKSLNDLLG